MMNEFNATAMNWADYAIIGLIFVSAVISLVRGFVREAISLVTWVVALVIGFKFAPLLAGSLARFIHTPSIRVAVAFMIIFFIILILGSLINYLITTLVNKTGLSGTDRLLGMIFGVARGVLLVGVIVLLGQLSAVNKNQWWEQSQLIPKFQGIATWLKEFVPDQLQKVKMDDQKSDLRLEMKDINRAVADDQSADQDTAMSLPAKSSMTDDKTNQKTNNAESAQ